MGHFVPTAYWDRGSRSLHVHLQRMLMVKGRLTGSIARCPAAGGLQDLRLSGLDLTLAVAASLIVRHVKDAWLDLGRPRGLRRSLFACRPMMQPNHPYNAALQPLYLLLAVRLLVAWQTI